MFDYITGNDKVLKAIKFYSCYFIFQTAYMITIIFMPMFTSMEVFS